MTENTRAASTCQRTPSQPISRRAHPDLLLVGQLLVLLGQDLGQVQVAHLRVDFGIFGSFFHEEAKVWRQRLLGEIWMSLYTGVGSEKDTQDNRKTLMES